MYGGNHGDVLKGGSKADKLYGGNGNDVLWGQFGNDKLHGGKGADTLKGGAQGYKQEGGTGDDTLSGGGGADVFLYAGDVDEVADLITDFKNGTDLIQIGCDITYDALAIEQVGGDTHAKWLFNTVNLEGITGTINENDFIFV